MKDTKEEEDLEREDGTVATTDTEKAEVLNQFFTSVFTIEDKENMPTMEERHGGNILPELEISMHEVMEKLTKLKVDNSTGPTGGTHMSYTDYGKS